MDRGQLETGRAGRFPTVALTGERTLDAWVSSVRWLDCPAGVNPGGLVVPVPAGSVLWCRDGPTPPSCRPGDGSSD